MKKIVPVVCLSLLSLALSGVAQAQSRSNSGTIHFIGQVVEGGCNVSPSGQGLQIACYRDGAIHEQHVAMSTTSSTPFKVISRIDRRTLPGNPYLQEVTISYL